jgi:tetratricopeptide (TPR) repeat protein
VGASAASSGFGSLLGLVFGIPRALAATTPQTAAETTGYAGNTNLEQISDWLTKLLVGAGLTQLGRIPSALADLGDYLGRGLGNGTSASTFAIVLTVFSSVAGFFFGYLFARLVLPRAFSETDKDSRAIIEIKQEIQSRMPPAPDSATSLQRKDRKAPESEREAAKEIAAKVVTLEKKTPGAAFTLEEYLRVAQGLYDAKQYDDAVNILELAADQHDDPMPLVYAGAIRGKEQEKYSDATRLYFKALKMNPDLAEAYYNLACNEIRQEHVDEARRYLEGAFALERDRSLREYAQTDEVWNDWRANSELKPLLSAAAEAASGRTRRARTTNKNRRSRSRQA